MRHVDGLSVRSMAIALFVYLTLSTRPAEAEVTSAVVDYQAPFGTYNGVTYTYVEGTLSGTVDRPDPEPDGTYAVGFVMAYPLEGGNRVGLVELPNSAFNHYYGFGFCPRNEYPVCEDGFVDTQRRLEDTVIQFSRSTLEDFMWEEGYTYLAIAWDKAVVDFFGPTPPPGRHNRVAYGIVERGTDADFIKQDAARFLRDPSAFEGADAPQATSTVISMGFSQGAMRQQEFARAGLNFEADGSLIYDGFLAQANGSFCWPLTDEPPLYEIAPGGIIPCDPVVPELGDAKFMKIATESEALFLASAIGRGSPEENPNYIQYDLAGVAHLPTTILDVSWVGATRANPADARPFIRGALRNLTAWIVDGTAPPPPAYLEGEVDPKTGMLAPATDEDGNTLGGIRLPHMPTVIDGEPAGAPTGTYGGLDTSFLEPLNLFALMGGTYVRLGDEELEKRYPDPEVYVDLVTRSAEKLFEDGYITERDRDAYVSGPVPLPDLPDDGDANEDDDTNPLGPPDSGCSVGSTPSQSPGWSVLLGVAACLPLLRRRRRGRAS